MEVTDGKRKIRFVARRDVGKTGMCRRNNDQIGGRTIVVSSNRPLGRDEGEIRTISYGYRKNISKID
jgi:hypothetical protein